MDALKASVMCSRATLFGIATWPLAKEKEAYDTGYSQAVTNPSTNPAPPGLTSVIGRNRNNHHRPTFPTIGTPRPPPLRLPPPCLRTRMTTTRGGCTSPAPPSQLATNNGRQPAKIVAVDIPGRKVTRPTVPAGKPSLPTQTNSPSDSETSRLPDQTAVSQTATLQLFPDTPDPQETGTQETDKMDTEPSALKRQNDSDPPSEQRTHKKKPPASPEHKSKQKKRNQQNSKW